MKITDKILTNLCLSTLLLFSLFSVFSCSDDDDDVRIYSVWSNMLAEEARQITSVYTGTWIRVDGSGFSGLQAIYCNGLQVTEYNSTYMSDSHLTFKVPSSVPMAHEIEDESVKNTLRVVTSHGEGVYRFIFKDVNKIARHYRRVIHVAPSGRSHHPYREVPQWCISRLLSRQ